MKKVLFILALVVLSVPAFAQNRLKDKPAVSSPASDDKIYIDGSTNGVRALDPLYYAPKATTLAGYGITDAITAALVAATYQPLNARLVSFAALANSAGFLYNNGSGILSYSNPGGGNVSNTGTPVAGQLAVWTDSTHVQGSPAGSLAAAPQVVSSLSSNALVLSAKEWPVKTAAWSTNQVLTYTGGSNTAGDGLVIVATVTSPITLSVTPTGASVYRNGSTSALASSISVPAGIFRIQFWTPGNGAVVYMDDTILTSDMAVNIPLADAGNYFSTRNVEAAFQQVGAATKILTEVTLADGATVTQTLVAGTTVAQNAKVTLLGNRTFAFSGLFAGANGNLRVIQDSTGSRTLALPANSRVNGSTTTVTLLTAAAAENILSWYSPDGTALRWTVGTY